MMREWKRHDLERSVDKIQTDRKSRLKFLLVANAKTVVFCKFPLASIYSNS